MAVIETKRLLLRAFTERDGQDFFMIMSNSDINMFLPWFPIRSYAESCLMLQGFISPSEYCLYYAVCLRRDKRPIGYLSLVDLEGSRKLGYGLRKEFWNCGIITEACEAVIRELRGKSLPFITATHDKRNPASGAVMKKLGMTYRYSYHETVQPKNEAVVFRLYQLNFDGSDAVYWGYWERSPYPFIEKPPS